MIKWYLDTWWTIIARPIYFYAKLKEESWKEKALTFFMTSAWILAASSALAVFVLQYIPIGSTLVEGIAGIKFLIILPVLITLALVFFVITALILGGVFIAAFGIMFYLTSFTLHYLCLLWEGKSKAAFAVPMKSGMNHMLQGLFYSSAAILAFLFPVLFAVMTKFNVLDFKLFRVGYNLVYCFTLLYTYGLWAVAVRSVYRVPKWKAFTAALLPIGLLLIFGALFDKIALPRLETWITPLK
ncbi:hypothetical protein HZB08_01910 [Candidatus Saganbacteria bacterium]|uniref:Yip1 domain-containing protein n=1 Tax=Candidatus Saganbacteria bacterium TaxID=2575572 RepID=A0A9D6UJY3_UNCSA|nr:hypothetical protein [Candidatus Saganbacteria bacterium]